MSNPDLPRIAPASHFSGGGVVFYHTLTPSSITEPVHLVVPPNTLPQVYIVSYGQPSAPKQPVAGSNGGVQSSTSTGDANEPPKDTSIAGQIDLCSDGIIDRSQLYLPLYSFEYDRSDGADAAAQKLKDAIMELIDEINKKEGSFCCEVMLMCHPDDESMARACQKLDGMKDKIGGIIVGKPPKNQGNAGKQEEVNG